MKNKTVVITGGGSGIGRAMVKKFSQSGSRVYFIDSNDIAGKKLEEEEQKNGHSVTFWKADVTDFDSIKACIASLPGSLDVLINNAGISHIGTVQSTSEDDFERLFQVNVKGIFVCTKASLPKLLQDGGGSILNMCSVAATMGLADRFAYSMTKGAALSMTLSIARDYVDKGIRCNCLSPGRVHTPFVDDFLAKNYPGKEQEMYEKLAASQPIGRMGKPEEIAELAYFISSEKCGFITGVNYPIDGGFLNLKV